MAWPPNREKSAMLYKTIVLELLKERPGLHEELRASRTLLANVNRHAACLKASHEVWIERLRTERPGSDRAGLSSEGLRLAISEWKESLPCEPPQDGTEALSVGEVTAFIRRLTPTA
jgi:hypothetical protein